MVGYNLTGLVENSTGILTFTQGVNDVLMFGWLGNLFLIILSVIIFISSIIATNNDVKRSFATTSFITFVFAIFLRALNLVPDITMYITLILTAISLATIWRTD